MYTLKVGTAEKYQDIDQNETRLRVPFTIMRAATDEAGEPILDAGEPTFEVVHEMNESFALETPQADIFATLKQHLNVFTEEKAREQESREHQAKLDTAQETADEISNIVIA